MNSNFINFSNLTVEKLVELKNNYCTLFKQLNDDVANLDLNNLTYYNCFERADEIMGSNALEDVLLNFDELHPSEEIRNKSVELQKDMSIFSVDESMRRDVYKVISHYYNNQYKVEKDSLDAEQQKYVENTIIGYEMLGLGLEDEQYERVKEINKQLSTYGSDYSANISNVNTEVYFTLEELDGMEEDWLTNRFDSEKSAYKVKLQYPDYIPIIEYCKVRQTRKTMAELMGARCLETNLPILNSSIKLRQERAKIFGFESHSDYKLQLQMAKNSQNVLDFLSKLLELMKPLAKSDIEKLKGLAFELDGLDSIETYDSAYYSRIYTEMESKLDMKDLKKLFTIESVTNGIFSIYQELLSFVFVDITEQHPDSIYNPDVKLFCVYDESDQSKSKPLGYFYLDLFPREGKFSHAAMFTFIRKSKFNLPISAIVCNFDPKLNVDFDNVVTYFHEFGHLMHNMSSTNTIDSLSGTACQRDFVETPSQMFEEWCYCLNPLKRLVIPEYLNEVTEELVGKINKQNKQMQGIFNSRQITYGLLDMTIHSKSIPEDTWTYFYNLNKELFGWEISNKCNMLANWGHMFGYDSSYYGYLWSKVFSIDLFSFFKDKEFDKELGLRLRNEILAKGGALDGDVLLKNFMNREPNPNAYIEWLAQ